MRDYNQEYRDNTRKYAYNFDYLLRDYMMQAFSPFLVPLFFAIAGVSPIGSRGVRAGRSAG